MRTVAIVGLGLMGGSLGLALRQSGKWRVQGYARRAETRETALKEGVVDAVFASPGEALAGAQVAVLCVPVLTIAEMLRSCVPAAPDGCVITDVGSTKAEIMDAASACCSGQQVFFVGSHPMAGSEQTGVAAARADLYGGATVILTPGERAPAEAVQTVTDLWVEAGAQVAVMDAHGHDAIVARTSHLPHVVAAILAQAVLGDGQDMARFCGPGFRDTTRVAAGSEAMWHDIVKSNRKALSAALADYGRILEQFSALLEAGDFEGIRAFLATARAQRESVGGDRPKGGEE